VATSTDSVGTIGLILISGTLSLDSLIAANLPETIAVSAGSGACTQVWRFNGGIESESGPIVSWHPKTHRDRMASLISSGANR
jgi:hypothetical protein